MGTSMKQDAFHCRDCEWSQPITAASDRRTTTKQAISHHVETGHELVTADRSRDAIPVSTRSGRGTTSSL